MTNNIPTYMTEKGLQIGGLDPSKVTKETVKVEEVKAAPTVEITEPVVKEEKKATKKPTKKATKKR